MKLSLPSFYRSAIKFLTSHQYGLVLSLLMQAMAGKPSSLSARGSIVDRICNYWRTPFAVASLFSLLVYVGITQIVLAMPNSRGALGTDLVKFLSTVRSLSFWVVMPLAIGGIYLSAGLKFAWTSAAMKMLKVFFKERRAPDFRWYLMRASYGCLILGILVAGAGYLVPYLMTPDQVFPLEDLLDREPKLAWSGLLLIVTYLHFRLRNQRDVNIEIWGGNGIALLFDTSALLLALGSLWIYVQLIGLALSP